MSGGNKQNTSETPTKSRGWIHYAVFVMCLIAAALISGFFVFAYNITTRTPPSIIPKADAVVVLTGRDAGRLGMAASLLERGYGERLLVSGVNPAIERQELLNILDLPQKLASCCVDYDYAKNTEQNGQETANWAQALGFEHIILVTSSYHMPRAQAEISNANGRIQITPYPVKSSDAYPWWKDSKLRKRFLKEYGKLLLSYVRAPSDRAARKPIALDLQRPPEAPMSVQKPN